MSTYIEIIGPGTASILAEQDGNDIYEPVVTTISVSSPQIINVATGNLTMTTGTAFEALDYSYIPSGYTNLPFIAPINDSNLSLGGSFKRSWLNNNGTETAAPLAPGAITSTGTKGYFEFNTLNSGSLSRHMMTQKFALFTGNGFPLIQASDYLANASGVVVPWSWTPIRPQFIQGRVTIYDIDERLDHIEESGVLSLLPNQKIGIGTYAPTEKLDVEGNIEIDGGYINPIEDNNILNITGYIV